MDLYAVLEIPRDADQATIRGAYRILARRYHPDRGAGSSAERFRQVKEAYETLVDSGSRHAYDLSVQWAERPVPVRVQPTVVRSAVLRREDPRIFGRFERAPLRVTFHHYSSLDMFFDAWLGLYDNWWPH